MIPKISPSGGFGEMGATILALLGAGAAGALTLAIAEGGYASLEHLLWVMIVPGIALLLIVAVVAWLARWQWLWSRLIAGLWIGAVATVGLEAIRIPGFRIFHSMPGDLPTLIGVLITGRIMEGPSTWSTILGYADHFWNGAAFAILYMIFVGSRRWWAGTIFGIVVGTGFLLSPVPVAMGVGLFGAQWGAKFAITVYLAHMVYGTLIAVLVQRYSLVQGSVFGALPHWWKAKSANARIRSVG